MAIESTQNIRTVFEFNRQKAFTERFSKLADESVRYEILHANSIHIV
jgi:urease beta subunit